MSNKSRAKKASANAKNCTETMDTLGNYISPIINNNQGSTTFKVVRTKASNPSFYMGFLSFTAAIGAAVLLSTYYRNKDLED